MIEWRPFRYGLILIVLTAVSGFIGFIIVYHYATLERPLQQFAIVIDAGSTQTRSNLFSIDLDMLKINKLVEHPDNKSSSKEASLEKMFHIKQVDSCVNGGPLADVQSMSEARELLTKCVQKFSMKIKLLDLKGIHPLGKNADSDLNEGSGSNEAAIELAKNNAVNSITHLYLGATAGMRALRVLNESKANEKIHWMDRAINESKSLFSNEPFINKGFVGIISGPEEAAFGWISVNFISGQLRLESPQNPLEVHGHTVPAYNTESSEEIHSISNQIIEQNLQSIGILELGGASAQMAYEVASNQVGEIDNMSLKDLELFNRKYKIATRSDLCLGMSQAVLRAQYIILNSFYENFILNSTLTMAKDQQVELVNPCLQNQAIIRLDNKKIREFLRGACLVSPQEESNNTLKEFLQQREMILFKGSGNVKQCDVLLSKLIEPQLCSRYFSICPNEKSHQTVPKNMSFVTVSGYNYVLQVLNLTKAPIRLGSRETEHIILSKLGGYSIVYQELLDATERYCSRAVGDFPKIYPKIQSKYQNIICLQLVYIRKLLTEFYLINPRTDEWSQIKFLIFPTATPVLSKLESKRNSDSHQDKSDIGWTLGLLLNATSLFYSTDDPLIETIIYHQGSSVLFVLRAIIFLMFACILMAISLITMAMITAHHHQRKAYISADTNG